MFSEAKFEAQGIPPEIAAALMECLPKGMGAIVERSDALQLVRMCWAFLGDHLGVAGVI